MELVGGLDGFGTELNYVSGMNPNDWVVIPTLCKQ
jgi:hypothetical protein